MLSPDDLQSVVREDLRYLQEEWRDDVSVPALRRASPMLRRLLVDGELQRAWKASGLERQPKIHAPCLESCLARIGSDRVSVATAGGAMVQGTRLAGAMLLSWVPSEDEIGLLFRSPDLPSRDWPLTEYMSAPVVWCRGRLISRRAVVKYVANKLGGSHHDTKRSSDEEGIDFASLDRLSRDGGLFVNEIPQVYFELLSIGQAVAGSPDVCHFVNLSDDKGDLSHYK